MGPAYNKFPQQVHITCSTFRAHYDSLAPGAQATRALNMRNCTEERVAVADQRLAEANLRKALESAARKTAHRPGQRRISNLSEEERQNEIAAQMASAEARKAAKDKEREAAVRRARAERNIAVAARRHAAERQPQHGKIERDLESAER